MNHAEHASQPSVTRQALDATRHCLTGCAIGEIVGLVLSGALGLTTEASVVAGIALAFVFGYSFTFIPLLRGGMAVGEAVGLTLAADTISIVVMETVDNLIVLFVPGAMAAGLGDPLFWGSLVLGLVIAFAAAFPVNRWLIARGRGHAVVHGAHR
jgi:hypothetical protein